MKGKSQGLARPGAILLGMALGGALVFANGFAAFNFLPSSYERFTWEAYAAVVYTNTPTATPTSTPSATPSATPSRTPSDQENSAGSQACDDGIDNDNNGLVDCADAACNGTAPCGLPAPTTSNRALVIIVALLFTVGFFALAPLRSRKQH